MSPEFLDVDDVLEIHNAQIADHGGSIEVRDRGLLESAVAMPGMTFGGEFLHDGLFAMAAAYLFHIVMNHPFVDGNKRTGLDAALTFLKLNGVEAGRPDDERLYDAILAVIEGRMNKSDLAVFFAEIASEG
jgi:death-on-curing protein